MTKLSPAQKALAAFNERHELCGPFDDDWVEQCLAAALEAVADQVVPSDAAEPRNNLPMALECQRIRAELLAIAAELRGDTITTETP
jgi:hypothetical protein